MSESPAPTPTPPAAAPATSGNRVLIIIVCVVFGFVLLVGGCVATCTYLVSRKAREISREAQKNPVFASLSLAASLNPEVQVLSKDEASGKITVRNKRTGETVTINANDFTSENIGRAVEQMTQRTKAAVETAGGSSAVATNSGGTREPGISEGKAAAMDAILKNFPDYVPTYPGGTTIVASQRTLGGIRASNYVFFTTDKLETAVDFYLKKTATAGFTVLSRNGDTNDYGPTVSLGLMHPNPQVTISVNAASQEGGKTQVSIDVTEVGK